MNESRLPLREARALLEVGVQNHGWYMTESEHRGVLEVLNRLDAALEEIARAEWAPRLAQIAREARAPAGVYVEIPEAAR